MYKDEKKRMFKLFTWLEIIKSFIFSVALTTLVIAPLVALFINVLLLYVWHTTLWLSLISVFMGAWGYLLVYWFYDTLVLYREDSDLNIKYLRRIEGIPFAIILFLIGMGLTLFVVPNFLG